MKFPLRHKSEVADIPIRFYAYALTQFHLCLQCIQCDNGGEFITHIWAMLTHAGVLQRDRGAGGPQAAV